MKRVTTILTLAAALSHFAVFAQAGNNSLAGADSAVQEQNNDAQSTQPEGAGGGGQYPSLSSGHNPYGGRSPLVFGSSQGYTYRVNGFSRLAGSAQKPLIIRSADMSPKDEANLQEDLAVMAHLLDKALDDLPGGQARARSAMGIDVFVNPASGASGTMYLQGYGALFLLNVGFPLLAPASNAPEEKPSGDSAWEEARQELYGQSLEPQTLAPQGEEFSEEKVNRLKETLLKTLKNASNIRGLQGDLTVCVLGGPDSSLVSMTTLNPNGPHHIWELSGNGQSAPAHGTVLTIKVTKADVDAFAKGELKFSDFRERARFAAYTTAALPSSSYAVGFGSGRAGAGAKR